MLRYYLVKKKRNRQKEEKQDRDGNYSMSVPEDDSLSLLDPEFSSRFPLRILLAEDNEINQLVMERILGKLGYSVKIARNGREALEFLEKGIFDLIFMDVEMPEVDGLEASRRIRENAETYRNPVIIALTAHAMDSDRKKCLDAGMDVFLTKPITLSKIVDVLREWAAKLRNRDGADS